MSYLKFVTLSGKHFSFVPGKSNLEYATPYDSDVVRSRPFASLGDGRYLLIDACYCTRAPLYRLPECFDTPKLNDRLRSRRDDSLEDEAARLLAPVMPDAALYRSYYVPVGKEGKLAERDLLIVIDDVAFVVESKASPLRSVKKRGDKIARLASDVKKTIQHGYEQASSVIELMRSSGNSLELFDRKGNKTDTISLEGVKHFIPIVTLDSYFGLIATDLHWWRMQIDPAIGYPWVVDTDTLESILLLIDNKQKLLNFVLWRRTLHGNATNEDEAVFAGFFFRHGPVEIPSNESTIVQLQADYADVFEAEYFRRQGHDIEKPSEIVTPPVWSSMDRDGDTINFRIDGKLHDTIDIKMGSDDDGIDSNSRESLDMAAGRPGRNSPCPCGSGKNYKKCCLELRTSF